MAPQEPESSSNDTPGQDVVEGSVLGILIHQNFRPRFANLAFTKLFGYSHPDEVLQLETIWPLIAPPLRADLQRDHNALIQGESAPTHYELQGLHRDGSQLWLENVVSLITWEGEPALQVVVIDITATRQMVQEQLQLGSHLQQEQQLNAMSNFAAGIAHDFNNLLGAIRGYLEIARLDISTEHVAASNLQAAVQAVFRARELSNQLITFSQQRTGEQVLVNLLPLIEEVRAQLQPTLPANINFQQDGDLEAAFILADETQMHQVIMNLCHNAVQAMRETGGEVGVQIEAIEHDGSDATIPAELAVGPYIRLLVRDAGSGIPSDVRARIFEPFFTTKRETGGTGMGLAIVQRIVTSQRGAIRVESEPGQGTIFSLYFPQLTPTSEIDQSPAPSLLTGSERVLLVSLETELAQMIRVMLERLGYEVVIRTSNVEALAAVQAMPTRFDVVITDQEMPSMSSGRLTQELRLIRPTIAVVLCLGFSHDLPPAQAATLGIDAVCHKPIVLEDLSYAIRRALGRRATDAASARVRILVIDDDASTRDVLRQTFESAGYYVAEAHDGRDGVRQHQLAPADVVITDLLMPEQEGLETIRILRQFDPTIRIIAISGGGSQSQLNLLNIAGHMGANHTLTKPLDLTDLLNTVRHLLSQS